MNKKGNIIIIGLVILNIILITSNIIYMNIKQILIFNQIDPDMEIMKIKIIQRVEKEYENKTKDFELNENDIYVKAEFDGLDYYVTVDGSYYYEMLISYDFVFECIENIEYYYENDSY